MKVEYEFVNPALRDIKLEHNIIYMHPQIHSVTLVKDEYDNDKLVVTVIVPVESSSWYD